MNIKSILTFVLVVAVFVILFQQSFVQEPVLDFLNQNIAWSIPLFTFIRDNVLSGTLAGLLIFLVFVNIPILPSPPAEAYIIFSFTKGTSIFGIVLITILVYLAFGLVYYLIGRLFGQRVLENIFKKPITVIPFLERFIGPIIFFTYLLPVPLPISLPSIVVLVAGFYKTKLSKVLSAVVMGTLLRVLLIVALYYLYTPIIDYYLGQLDKLLKIG